VQARDSVSHVTGSTPTDDRDRGLDVGAPSPAIRRLTLVAGIVLPVTAYVVLKATTHNTTDALAVTETIPVVWILAGGLLRRRLNPIAVIAAVVLGGALAITALTGGSALPLKLRRASVTGPLGIACLLSVAIHRPLLPALVKLVARSVPPRATGLIDRFHRAIAENRASVLTAIVGITLLADAVAQVTLALTVSTTVFIGTSRLARIILAAAGLAACGFYLSSADRSALPDRGTP
jgi:hypothetical protein